MSIPIQITKQELRTLRKVLRSKSIVVCIDEASYLKTLLVARDLLMTGKATPDQIATIQQSVYPEGLNYAG